MIRNRVKRLMDFIRAGCCSLDEMKAGFRYRWQTFYETDEEILAGLMPWETALFDRFIRPGMEVLLVGSGSGRDTVDLARRGCRVTGIEPSGDALRISERVLAAQGLRASFVEGFIEDLAVAGSFDVVMFSYNTYTIIPEAKRRIDVLRKAASLLKPGGMVIVSYLVGQIRARHIFSHAGRLAGALTGSDWRVEHGDIIKFAIDHPNGIQFCHCFVEGEVSREAAVAGLQTLFTGEFEDAQWAVALAPTARDRAAR
jgi:2-polyprenyl-3-methyl-5-hydroxy-6-metoxy-1,4-benzoquinol methylase